MLGVGDRLLTSDHVLIETWLLLRYRLGRYAAERFWAAFIGAAGIAIAGALSPSSRSAAGLDRRDSRRVRPGP